MSPLDPAPPANRQDETWAIGIDLGGTKLAAGLVRFPDPQVFGHVVVPMAGLHSSQQVLDELIRTALRLRDEALSLGHSVAGVGIGVPELVDPQGRVTSHQTIDWRTRSLADELAEVGTVRVEADVRAAALAEARWGAGQSYRQFVYVSVGTGISSTWVHDGRPFAGARGNALVLASSPVSVLCPNCNCVVESMLEELASGPGIVRRYNQTVAEQVASASEVLARAEAGVAPAQQMMDEAATLLGSSVAWLVNVLDPEAVVIGGGLGTAGGAYWDLLVAAVRRHIWADNTRVLPIVPAALGANAGVIGAAAVACEAP